MGGEQWKVVSLVALRKSEKPEEVGEKRAKRERWREAESEKEKEKLKSTQCQEICWCNFWQRSSSSFQTQLLIRYMRAFCTMTTTTTTTTILGLVEKLLSRFHIIRLSSSGPSGRMRVLHHCDAASARSRSSSKDCAWWSRLFWIPQKSNLLCGRKYDALNDRRFFFIYI